MHKSASIKHWLQLWNKLKATNCVKITYLNVQSPSETTWYRLDLHSNLPTIIHKVKGRDYQEHELCFSQWEQSNEKLKPITGLEMTNSSTHQKVKVLGWGGWGGQEMELVQRMASWVWQLCNVYYCVYMFPNSHHVTMSPLALWTECSCQKLVLIF